MILSHQTQVMITMQKLTAHSEHSVAHPEPVELVVENNLHNFQLH